MNRESAAGSKESDRAHIEVEVEDQVDHHRNPRVVAAVARLDACAMRCAKSAHERAGRRADRQATTAERKSARTGRVRLARREAVGCHNGVGAGQTAVPVHKRIAQLVPASRQHRHIVKKWIERDRTNHGRELSPRMLSVFSGISTRPKTVCQKATQAEHQHSRIERGGRPHDEHTLQPVDVNIVVLEGHLFVHRGKRLQCEAESGRWRTALSDAGNESGSTEGRTAPRKMILKSGMLSSLLAPGCANKNCGSSTTPTPAHPTQHHVHIRNDASQCQRQRTGENDGGPSILRKLELGLEHHHRQEHCARRDQTRQGVNNTRLPYL